jgi:hypothetical protein
MELYDLFMTAYPKAAEIPWRVYGGHSHRLLTPDYRQMRNDELDSLRVSKIRKINNSYWCVVLD